MTKEQLRAYRDIRLEFEALKELIQRVEATRYDLRAQNLDGMPRGGSTPSSSVEDNVIKYDALLGKYEKKKADLVAALLEIEEAMDSLSDPLQRAVVRHYYAEGMTWEEVCVAINYSRSQTHRIHAAALEALRGESTE